METERKGLCCDRCRTKTELQLFEPNPFDSNMKECKTQLNTGLQDRVWLKHLISPTAK